MAIWTSFKFNSGIITDQSSPSPSRFNSHSKKTKLTLVTRVYKKELIREIRLPNNINSDLLSRRLWDRGDSGRSDSSVKQRREKTAMMSESVPKARSSIVWPSSVGVIMIISSRDRSCTDQEWRQRQGMMKAKKKHTCSLGPVLTSQSDSTWWCVDERSSCERQK